MQLLYSSTDNSSTTTQSRDVLCKGVESDVDSMRTLIVDAEPTQSGREGAEIGCDPREGF